MREGLLPLFPLQAVLFPRTPLPLHIFEDRYKEMIGELIEAEQAFGVVLLEGKGILRIGCTATIEKLLQKYDDGRMDILTFGGERFEIREVDDGRSFLRGEVVYFDDDDFEPAEAEPLRRAVRANAEYRRLTASEEDPDLDDPQLSFQLARVTPDLGFRQLLLVMRSEAERMGRVADHLEVLIVRHHMQEQARKVARTNGHTKTPLKLDDRS
jgi:Lon protease-like protein